MTPVTETIATGAMKDQECSSVGGESSTYNQKKTTCVSKEENEAVKARPVLAKRTPRQTLRRQARHRQGLVIFNALATIFFVGGSLGWGPMQLMLEENGSYSSRCSTADRGSGIVCDAQTSSLLRIGLIMMTTQLSTPFLGYMVDRFGPVKAAYGMATVSLTALTTACIAVATGTDALLYVVFPLTTTCTWMGSLLIVQLGFYFQGHTASRVIFILNTLFDSGALTYWILWFIQDRTRATVLAVLMGYLLLAVVIYGGSCYFWTIAVKEDDAIDTTSVSSRYLHYLDEEREIKIQAGQQLSSMLDLSRHSSLNLSRHGAAPALNTSRHSAISVLDCEEDTQFRVEVDSDAETSGSGAHEEAEKIGVAEIKGIETDVSGSSNYVIVADRTVQGQLTSYPFLLICIFFGLQVTSTNWNLSTQRDFLAYLGDDEEDNLYLTIFTWMTPLSLLGVPFVDYVILHFNWGGALQGINLLALAYTLVKVVSDDLNVQVIGFVMFSFYRSFLFGVTFSFLPTLMGAALIGRAAGLMFFVVGATGFLGIPLAELAISKYDGDFFVPNVVFVLLNIPTTIAVWTLGNYIKKEEEAKMNKLDGFVERCN